MTTISKNEEMLEPVYYEDEPDVQIILIKPDENSKNGIYLIQKKNYLFFFFEEISPIKSAIHKSNSTSSLFIKDTIILPNIDDLTKAYERYTYHLYIFFSMSISLHDMIEEGHKNPNPQLIRIFNEEINPLTNTVFFIVH